MKKFAFSLERMLGFKRTVYEKERNTLAHMRATRAALQQRRDATEQQMLAKDAEFREKAAHGVRMAEVTSVSFHRENADKLIKQMDGELAEMDIAIERQLLVVIELDKEVKSLEKLREAQWEAWRADEAREERERILELVSGKYDKERREEAEAQKTAH